MQTNRRKIREQILPKNDKSSEDEIRGNLGNLVTRIVYFGTVSC